MRTSSPSKISIFWFLNPAFCILALVGFWMPWLTQPAAALRLNGFDLAEWVTWLPSVRDGTLPLSRLALLMPAACLAVLLGLAAASARPSAEQRRRGWRGSVPASVEGWGLLALALVCNLFVLPPYEAFTRADYWPDYQSQFWVACAALAGIGVCQFLPSRVKTGLQMVFALVGGGYGAWTLILLRPTANELLNASWSVGYGWGVMLIGFAGLIVSGGIQLVKEIRDKGAGKGSQGQEVTD